MSDRKVGDLINERFVASYEQVGRFVTQATAHASTRWGRKTREPALRKLGGNVVSYFCTPKGEVLFYVVGPVEAETLLAAGQWAEKTYERLKQASVDTAQGRALLRDAHLQSSYPASRAAFANAYQSRWQVGNATPPGLPGDLGALFAAAKEARESGQKAFATAQLRAAYPNDDQLVAEAGTWGRAPLRDPEAQRQLEQAHRLYYEAMLAYHKDFAAQSAHLVLAETPLVKLSDVQQEVFERQAGQRFQQRTQRNDDLLQAVKELRQRKQPLLMLVAARGTRHRNDSIDDIPRRSLTMLKSKPVAELLPDFELLELSPLELTTLRDDLNEEPVRVTNGYMAAFVVLDGAGRLVAGLGEYALSDQLAAALRRALPEDAAQRTAEKEPETVAARELRLAVQLLEQSPVTAQRRLRSLVANHPRTTAARKAQELLPHRD